MDTAQWPQGIGVVKAVEKKPRPQKEQALNCPRCSSTNTKFCYYNNYSLTQPRYFCKTCRRYWTEGGSLRNVPVGGGSRKHKRPSSSSSILSPTSSSKKLINTSDHLTHPNFSSSPQNPKIHGGHDLNLAYDPSSLSSSHYNINIGLADHHHHQFVAFPFGLGPKGHHQHLNPQNPSFIPLVSNSTNTNNNNNIIPVSDPSMYNNDPSLRDLKPCLGFSVDVGLENGYGDLQGVDDHHQHQQTSSCKSDMIFPFEELKQVPDREQQFVELEGDHRGQGGEIGNGFWSGMLAGGGSSW